MNLPPTRYYGSKRKLIEKIWIALEENHIEYDSVLDLFGGSGIVSYFMAAQGKEVIYNDIMRFNCEIATALLQSPSGILQEEVAENLLKERQGVEYHHFVEELYKDVYYHDNENRLIDIAVQNIRLLPPEVQASAHYVLFQSCMIKRPFNIFHRKNLTLRTNFTTAQFGNKKTWETPFEELFSRFSRELRQYQFSQMPNARIENASALNLKIHADLVYLDTPYFANNGSQVSYHNRYHFLEGLMNYEQIPNHVNMAKANKEMDFGKSDEFETKTSYLEHLHQLLDYHHNSIIAMSYTSNGYPNIGELSQTIAQHKERVRVVDLGLHPFALNRNNNGRREMLIVGM